MGVHKIFYLIQISKLTQYHMIIYLELDLLLLIIRNFKNIVYYINYIVIQNIINI